MDKTERAEDNGVDEQEATSIRDKQMTGHESIQSGRQLEFAVFCIESVAEAIGKTSSEVYRALSGENGLLRQYVIPSYDVLHTQGKDYIVNDIREAMAERGVLA